jgi:hypothetical protein
MPKAACLYAVATTRGLLDLSTVHVNVASSYDRISQWKTSGGATRAIAKAEQNADTASAMGRRSIENLKGAHVVVLDEAAIRRHNDVVEAPSRARTILQRYSATLANLAQLDRMANGNGGVTVNGTPLTPADILTRREIERTMWLRECSEWPLLVTTCGGTAEQWWAWQVEAARHDALTGPEREAERAARAAV